MKVEQVLIVDDSATARMIIRRCLEINGLYEAKFWEAPDGRAALDVLRRQPIDLLFTDLNMPTMDGAELLASIRGVPMFAKMRIAVITSADNPAKEEELRQLGADAVLSKPVTPAALAQVLEGWGAEYGGT